MTNPTPSRVDRPISHLVVIAATCALFLAWVLLTTPHTITLHH